MSHLLKLSISLLLTSYFLLLTSSPVLGAAAIGTNLAEGDISAQIRVVNMLIEKGATKEHPLTAMIVSGTPASEINRLCEAMTTLTDAPILRVFSLSGDTDPFPQTIAIANAINAATACPQSSYVSFLNELNEQSDTDYLLGTASLYEAGIKYARQFAAFKNALDPSFQLSAAAISIYHPINLISNFLSAPGAKVPWQNARTTACNVYEAPGFPTDILQTCQDLESMTGAADHPNVYPEYGPHPDKDIQAHLDWYRAHPSPPYPTTTLVPSHCPGSASRWLYYIQEGYEQKKDKIVDISGREFTKNCITSSDRDPYLLHPENLTEIASSYQLTYADPLTTQGIAAGDNTVCQNSICTTDLTENIGLNLSPTDKMPWYNEENQTYLSKTSAYNSFVGSGSTFWSKKRQDATSPKELATPFDKNTTRRTQFTAIMQYLERSDNICSQYPSPASPNPSRCPLPRDFKYEFDPQIFPYPTELDFYRSRLIGISYDQLSQALTPDEQQIFWRIVPQVQDGVEFKIAYWVSYLKKPASVSNPFFTFRSEPPLLHIVRFAIPVAIGEQANQLDKLQLSYSPSTPTSPPPIPPIQQTYFSDAMTTKTTDILLPKRVIDLINGNRQNSRKDKLGRTQQASVTGPCLNVPDAATDPLAEALVKFINGNANPCFAEAQTGESSQQTFTQARFNGFSSEIPGLFSSPFLSNIISFLINLNSSGQGEKEFKHYNYIIAPEETTLVEDTSRLALSTFHSRNQWAQIQSNPLLSPYYNIVAQQNTSAQNPSTTYTASPSAEGESVKTFTLGINTETKPLLANILGASLTNAFNIISGNATRRYFDPSSFTNSGCGTGANLSEKTDCYWKRLTTGTPPQASTPPQTTCDLSLAKPAGSWPGGFLPNPSTPYSLNEVWPQSAWPLLNDSTDLPTCSNQQIIATVTQSGVFPNAQIDHARLEYLKNQSLINPTLAIAIWIEESGASDFIDLCSQNPTCFADFGITTVPDACNNFDRQRSIFLGLLNSYRTSSMFDCRADPQVNFEDFLLFYSEGICTTVEAQNRQFVTNKPFPARLRTIYNYLKSC